MEAQHLYSRLVCMAAASLAAQESCLHLPKLAAGYEAGGEKDPGHVCTVCLTLEIILSWSCCR